MDGGTGLMIVIAVYMLGFNLGKGAGKEESDGVWDVKYRQQHSDMDFELRTKCNNCKILEDKK